METRMDEIASGVYRSIFAPDTAPPAGLTYNHFLISGDDPLLFHCGKRKMFPLVSAAVARIMPVEQLRWLAFGHLEADGDDESGIRQQLQVLHHTGRPVRCNDRAEIMPSGGLRL